MIMNYSLEEIGVLKDGYREMNIEDLEKKIKSFQSLKCRWKKIESKKEDMEKLLIDERIIREVIIEKKEVKVVIYERLEEDIKVMNIEEVMKGIKNIDSILCIEKSKNEEFINKEKIVKCNIVREWLIERKKEVSGNSNGKVNVSDVLRKLEDIEDIEELKKWLLEKSGKIEE